MPGSGLDEESISGPETLTQAHEIGLEVNCSSTTVGSASAVGNIWEKSHWNRFFSCLSLNNTV